MKKNMESKKAKVVEVKRLVCSVCEEIIEWCDNCDGDMVFGDYWWCYDHGWWHYCEECHLEKLDKSKEKKNENIREM